jgi:hypothetical protein
MFLQIAQLNKQNIHHESIFTISKQGHTFLNPKVDAKPDLKEWHTTKKGLLIALILAFNSD